MTCPTRSHFSCEGFGIAKYCFKLLGRVIVFDFLVEPGDGFFAVLVDLVVAGLGDCLLDFFNFSVRFDFFLAMLCSFLHSDVWVLRRLRRAAYSLFFISHL